MNNLTIRGRGDDCICSREAGADDQKRLMFRIKLCDGCEQGRGWDSDSEYARSQHQVFTANAQRSDAEAVCGAIDIVHFDSSIDRV